MVKEQTEHSDNPGYISVHIHGQKASNSSRGRCSGGITAYTKDCLKAYFSC